MTTLRKTLLPQSRLQPLVKDGLQALSKGDRGLLAEGIRSHFDDSLNLDAAMEKGNENDPRWDYLLGHKTSGKVIALEPHSATNHEVSVVIRKRAAAVGQLRDHFPPDARVSAWFWVSSGKVDFVPVDKQVLRLDQSGITFVGRQLRERHLPKSGG